MDRLSFRLGEVKRFIQQAETKLGVGSRELGQLVGLSPRTIRDWRREKYRPERKALLKLSKVCGLKLPPYQIILWKTHLKEVAHLGGIRRHQLHGLLGNRESRAKGGLVSWYKRKKDSILFKTYTNTFSEPKVSRDFAEFIGIMLGDGGLTTHQCTIYLNSETDYEYANYVRGLMKNLFSATPSISKHKKWKVLRVRLSGVNLVKYLTYQGLSVGNKVHLQVGVPVWIWCDIEYVKACVRGLIDTDGCFAIHRYKVNGRQYSYPKICFTNRSEPLLAFVYQGLKLLNFNPKRTFESEVWLHNHNEVREYLRVIGTHNYRPNVKRILEGDSDGYENGLLNHHGLNS